MNRDQEILDNINNEINEILAKFLIVVFGVVVAVVLLTYFKVFAITMAQTYLLMAVGVPSGVCGFIVLKNKDLRDAGKLKNILCILICLLAFAASMAAYAYAGTIVLLLPEILAALYPKSKACRNVTITMMALALIIPPLALVTGMWDGEYYEFLYTLSYGRQMGTSTLSNDMLTFSEQIISAIQYCSIQSFVFVGGFSLVAEYIYLQTNKSFESRKEIIRLSETDELTGLLNRNCYERKLGMLSAMGTQNTVCFYFDVNGLHELNNKKGHKAGDIMLQFVGKQIKDAFGEENTFRVGGDEYVAFCGNIDYKELYAKKEALEAAFASQGYNVAIGYAQSNALIDFNQLVQRAEQEMYQAKKEYYEVTGKSRSTDYETPNLA